ncbi:MAG: TRAP transporter small permease [Spirochaetales bacterium]|jgi:C4-dicarboxylate transporter DctQ subunit|nr:TRAP transporter small permease [Spirochaetales bacterium]
MNNFAAKINRAAEECIGYMVVATICIVTFGVAARMCNIAVAWTDELLRAIFIWLIFIGAAMAYKTGSLIGFDLLEEMLGRNKILSMALKFVQHTAAVVFSAFLSEKSFRIITTQINTGELTPVLELPLWIVNLGLFSGSVLMLLFALCKIWHLVRPPSRKG